MAGSRDSETPFVASQVRLLKVDARVGDLVTHCVLQMQQTTLPVFPNIDLGGPAADNFMCSFTDYITSPYALECASATNIYDQLVQHSMLMPQKKDVRQIVSYTMSSGSLHCAMTLPVHVRLHNL